MTKKSKKPTADEIIDIVTEIRVSNNGLWMRLLKIALEAEPELVREIIQFISDNDKDVTKWLKKL